MVLVGGGWCYWDFGWFWLGGGGMEGFFVCVCMRGGEGLDSWELWMLEIRFLIGREGGGSEKGCGTWIPFFHYFVGIFFLAVGCLVCFVRIYGDVRVDNIGI